MSDYIFIFCFFSFCGFMLMAFFAKSINQKMPMKIEKFSGRCYCNKFGTVIKLQSEPAANNAFLVSGLNIFSRVELKYIEGLRGFAEIDDRTFSILCQLERPPLATSPYIEEDKEDFILPEKPKPKKQIEKNFIVKKQPISEPQLDKRVLKQTGKNEFVFQNSY